ncbi:hypothetical protein Lfu02_78640 [Longispora fulva]|uniref:hypothetical protein n=1 Tax=Longispora fulva TaxID=619741 RepID=UPI001A398435|nr:hypothetical protein Lfu02_78640 [Longispora fulva]
MWTDPRAGPTTRKPEITVIQCQTTLHSTLSRFELNCADPATLGRPRDPVNSASGPRPRPPAPPLTGHEYSVVTVAFRPDGHLLTTGSQDCTVRLWLAGHEPNASTTH